MKSRIATWLLAALLLPAAGPAIADDARPAAPSAEPVETVLAPFSDHHAMRVEKPADVVWAHIKRLYVDGERMRQPEGAETDQGGASEQPSSSPGERTTDEPDT